MYRGLFFLSALALATADLPVIDKNVFKNCSRIPFCSTLRHRVLEDALKYTADIGGFSIRNNVVNVPLYNYDSVLNMQLYLLEGNKARVRIAELENTRFELEDIVIVEELKKKKLKVILETQSVLFYSEDSHHSIRVAKGPPFFVRFMYKGDILVVLDAERIFMQSTKESEAFTFGVEFDGSERLYGLFHHAYQLALKETMDDSSDPFRFRNSDSWAYEADSPMALYGTVPAIYGHSANVSSGIFLHNAAEQWIDITYKDRNPKAYFMVEGAAFDLFIFLGPTPKDLVRQITALTGKAHMPQQLRKGVNKRLLGMRWGNQYLDLQYGEISRYLDLQYEEISTWISIVEKSGPGCASTELWTLGYHQCRFSYKSQEDVKTVVARMDQNNFPFDAIWLDGDHTDDYRWFKWNHTTYTDPVDLQRNVSATGRKCVSISDPHIAVDNNYSVYLGAKDKYFVKWANGSNYEADCWPGLSSWIDFMIPEASDYYSSWFAFDKFNGSTETLAGIWNDMNEPAVFDDTIEKTLPFEVLHAGGVKHGDIHNIYGFMQTRATHKGLMDRDQQKKRPFILSRSTFAGSQRYAAMWTGDNSATWNHFANTYPECMTANLMGMVFCGADIGGFLGDPSDELLQRWYQGAVWTTFFRGHSSRESQRREPFLFSEEVQNVIRNAIRLRYQHIPVFYRLFFEHTRTGDPILRPLFYQYTDINERDTQMLIGTDIMSVAVTKPNITSVNVFIPGESEYWYRVDEGWSVHAGGKEVNAEINIATSPYYYRAGSIIVRQDTIVKSTTEALNASYSIYVNLDLNNQAEGRFYMDDFISFDYTNKNEYIYFSMRAINHKLIITPIDGNHGDLVAHLKEVIVHRIVTENDGKLGSSETTYIKTADGTPLESIDIGKELFTGEGLTIHL